MKSEYSIHFCYDKRGFGVLEIMHDETIVDSAECRTGSIDSNGHLVNACPPGLYALVDRDGPIYTDHPAMAIKKGDGWWCPFYKSGDRTHLGLHPDGGRGGSEGCVVFQKTDRIDIKEKLVEILSFQPEINVFVSKE